MDLWLEKWKETRIKLKMCLSLKRKSSHPSMPKRRFKVDEGKEARREGERRVFVLHGVKELPPPGRLAGGQEGCWDAGVCPGLPEPHTAGYKETRNLLYIDIYINVLYVQECTLKSMHTKGNCNC